MGLSGVPAAGWQGSRPPNPLYVSVRCVWPLWRLRCMLLECTRRLGRSEWRHHGRSELNWMATTLGHNCLGTSGFPTCASVQVNSFPPA